MKVFVRIDEVILSFFTKISHWWQRLTGLTNYWLAKCALMVVSISLLVRILNYWHPLLSHKTELGLLAIAGFLIIGCCICIMIIDEADTQAQNSDTQAMPVNVTMRGETFWRIWFVFLTLTAIAQLPVDLLKTKSIILELVNGCLCPSMACFLYFAAVNPLPPAKSKVREWIESFRPTPALQPMRIPEK